MKLLGKWSLQRNIVALSLALTVCIMGIFFVFYSHNRQQDLEENLTNYARAMSFQANQYFDERLHTLITRVYALTRSQQFQGVVSEYLSSDLSHQYQLTLTAFNAQISDIKLPDTFISGAYLYTPKGVFCDLSIYPAPTADFTETQLYENYLAKGAPSIYFASRDFDGFFGGSRPGIPVIIKVPIEGYRGDVLLVIQINSTAIDSYLTQSTFEGSEVIIMNADGEIIASSNPPMNQPYLEQINYQDGVLYFDDVDYIFSANPLSINDWFVVTVTSKGIIKEMLHSGIGLVVILQVIFILVAFLCALFFSMRIVQPLRKLQMYMNRFTPGEYSLCYAYDEDNEVGRLAQCFNQMVNKIGSLMGELNATIQQLQKEKENVSQQQTLKRTAELNALQAQIDPHFLYNSLNSIVWLAAEEECDKISLLADSLSRFYKYRIRGNQVLASLRDEVEQIKSYVEIQNIRYEGSIRCNFEVDPALLDEVVIKLTMQPLVENAIIHGLHCKIDSNNITVRICLDGSGKDLLITVEDDGAGIEQSRLDEINAYLAAGRTPSTGYGIGNVNARIKLYFGDRYGLWYQSPQGAGATALMRMPLITVQPPVQGEG